VKIAFIRHGKTEGNIQRRYIGSTDMPLCQIGIKEIQKLSQKKNYPSVQHVYVSPMMRCMQTADIAYHDTPYTVIENIREQHYGDFEYKTYDELQDVPAFRRWIDTSGASDAPNGEPQIEFFARCRTALLQILEDAQKHHYDDIAIVAHGGVLMALLSIYATPQRNFYDWHAANGCGFLFDADSWLEQKTITLLSKIDCEEL